MARTPCQGLSPCANDRHDHFDTGQPMVCFDCGVPTHYDYGIEDYRHDDPSAPLCWAHRND